MTRQHVLWLATPMFSPDPLQAKAEFSMPRADRLSMQGWMKKQKEGVFGHWRERWCVMYESGLFRYYSQPGPDGELDETYRKGKGDVSFIHLKTFGREDQFVWIGTRERMWRFDAGSEEASQLWLNAMTAPYQRHAEKEMEEILRDGRSGTQLSFSEEDVVYAPLKQPPKLGEEHKYCNTPSKSSHGFTFTPATPVYRSTSILRTKSEPCLKALEIDPQSSILKEGWLSKKGGICGIWRKRWCVLYECGLFRYYTKSDKISSNRKGKGDNSFVTVCDGGMAGKEFWIQTDERTWQFQAETICDAADWFDMLNTPCRNYRLKKTKSMIIHRDSESFTVWERKRANSESAITDPDIIQFEHSFLE